MKVSKVLDHSHSQPLHLTSSQLNGGITRGAPESFVEQFTINVHLRLPLHPTKFNQVIGDRSSQIRIVPFSHLVNKFSRATQSRSFSDPGFVV